MVVQPQYKQALRLCYNQPQYVQVVQYVQQQPNPLQKQMIQPQFQQGGS